VSKALAQICDCQIHGTDYSERHIDFARRFANARLRFHQNSKAPPLQFDSESFDAIFSLSVFTHFNHHSLVGWANEMHRVLKPGGILAVTLRGRAYNSELSITERHALENDGYCVRNEGSEYLNSCNAFFSPGCIRAAFAEFETVGFHESAREVSPREKLKYQDLWIFRKAYV
jgi:cyclopropane fatty-acyl-phospholipid synthase-like methyltransferase